MLAPTTPALTSAMMTVAIALTSGFRPSRARENTTSGKVVDPGPDKKADRITSSSDTVKVSSQADRIDWPINGNVINANTLDGVQPKSMAASSSERLSSVRRAWIVTVA